MYDRAQAICGHFEDHITLKLKVSSIAKRGDMVGVVYLLGADGNELAQINIVGDGGRFGSFYNLAGDGIRDAGEKLGKFLVKVWEN